MSARRSPVVVTGAAGNLGSRLVPWLEAAGREVRPVDMRPMDHPGAILDDLAETRDRSEWLEGAQAIVHLAGYPAAHATWDEVEGPNVRAVRNMVEAARRFGIERFVFASSVWAMRGAWERGGLVGAGPADPGDYSYGRSKRAAEAIVAASGVSSVVLRIGGRVPGDQPPHFLDEWENSCWLGWRDFLAGVDRARDAPVEGVATVTLISNNPARRWDLEPGRLLIGYSPRQRFAPQRPPSFLRRVLRRVLRG